MKPPRGNVRRFHFLAPELLAAGPAVRRAWQRLVGSFFFIMATFAVACVCLEIVEMATIPITKRGENSKPSCIA